MSDSEWLLDPELWARHRHPGRVRRVGTVHPVNDQVSTKEIVAMIAPCHVCLSLDPLYINPHGWAYYPADVPLPGARLSAYMAAQTVIHEQMRGHDVDRLDAYLRAQMEGPAA